DRSSCPPRARRLTDDRARGSPDRLAYRLDRRVDGLLQQSGRLADREWRDEPPLAFPLGPPTCDELAQVALSSELAPGQEENVVRTFDRAGSVEALAQPQDALPQQRPTQRK